MGSPVKVLAYQEDRQSSRGKRRARWAKSLARPAGALRPARGPKPSRLRVRPPRSLGIAGGVVLMLALLSVIFALTRHPGTAGAGDMASPQATVRDRAAAWVASQVTHAAPISCDQPMCQALQAHGVPHAALVELQPGYAHLFRSRIIVVTAEVTSMVGSRLVAEEAPAAIADFGSGENRISVRMIVRQGPAAYSSALRKDITARKAAGAELLQVQRIRMPATGRQQLAGGQVDSRVLLTLAQVASQWPISVVKFGDPAPGAVPGIPLRCADLVETGNALPGQATQVRLMSVFVHGLGEFYKDARIQTVRVAGGQSVLRIEFAAPSPLGLLSH